MKQVRVLQVVSELNQGGIENFIMNIYRSIDRNKIQFDFIVHHKAKGTFEDEIEKLGGKVYHFPVFDDKNVIKYIKELNKFFKKHSEYKVIHGHLASIGFLYLRIAKKHKIPCRIAHSHGTSAPKSFKGFIKFLLFKMFGKYSNIKFACSTEAGRFLFKDDKSFVVIPNAIDFNRFSFDINQRINLQNKYNLKNKFVIGHVGRFTVEKNHVFIIDLLCKILRDDQQIALLLVGDGKLRPNIQQKVNEMGLNDKVLFLGNRKDVEKIYNVMDVFILPSLFEGLPVTGIEAQVNGLPTLLADNVTKEVSISKLTKFISIGNIEEWKKEILSIKEKKEQENDYLIRENVFITNEDFNIINLVNKLGDFYLKFYVKENKNEQKINF